MNVLATYLNGSIHGIKSILVVAFLLVCFTFIYVPAVSCLLITDYNNMPFLLTVFTLFGWIIESGLLYLGLKLFFGKLYITIDDSKITLTEKIPAFKARMKEIDITSDSCIRMDCGTSGSVAGVFRSNGHTQVFALYPVYYNITVCDASQSTPVLSSANYELVEGLYQQLCSGFPACKTILDISKRDELLKNHNARVNKEKLKATRVFSFLALFASFLIALPLVSEYQAYQSAKVWCKTSGAVTILEKTPAETQKTAITYSWQEKQYIKSCNLNQISRHLKQQKNSEFVGSGDIVEIYVNPRNPGQYTLGPSNLSSISGIVAALVFFLSLFIVLLILSLKYRKINISFNRDV